jgi:hypothetical protein
VPDRKTHLGAGALVGVGVGLYTARNLKGWPAVARILGAVLASVIGAALPDAFEPALHSWHRRSFHSWGALVGTAGVTLGPPVAARRWMAEREAAAERCRAQREALPLDHPERAGLWLAEMFEHFLIAAAVGLPAGYASHLVLDAASPRGLPPA